MRLDPSIRTRLIESASVDFFEYQKDPVRFGEELLEENYTDDTKILMESVRDYRVTVARSANAVGKTFIAARIALWAYKTHPGAQIYLTAAPPLDNLELLLWGELSSICQKHSNLTADDKIGTLLISRNPQEFIAGRAIPSSGTAAEREAKFSGKHAPYLLFIVDEGDAVPEEVYKGIESCMSSSNAHLLILFNPRSETGHPARLEREGLANVVHFSAFHHPNVVSGKNVIPGAVSRNTTIERINKWTRPLAPGESPNPECFELPSFLTGAQSTTEEGKKFPPLRAGHYQITNPAFSYMVLGEYPAKGNEQLISKSWVQDARVRWDAYVAQFGEKPPSGIKPVMGQDVAEYGNDYNVACFRYGGFVAPFVCWNGMDILQTGERSSREYQARQTRQANIDSTGVGAGVAPVMQRNGCNAVRVMVASSPTKKTEMGEFDVLRDQLWWSVREWLRSDPGAMLPPDEELMQELITPNYEIKKGKIKIMSKDEMKRLLKRSPDKADALCLTFADESVPELKIRIF